MICRRCHEWFDPEPNDIRPNLWHVCPDGCITAHSNPGFNSHRRGEPTGEDSRDKMLRYDYKRRVYDK